MNEGSPQRNTTCAPAPSRRSANDFADSEWIAAEALGDRKLRGDSKGVPRQLPWDTVFLILALAHGWLLLWTPSLLLIAVGLWWNSNTIAHNFIHRPFFRNRIGNMLFSAYLSLLLGIPQRLWRDRHLAHHADRPWQFRISGQLIIEALVVATLWSILLGMAPEFFAEVYSPGWVLGLSLCALQGHYEHVRGAVSHYGRLYNWLFFNDGYHVEHHARPKEHWTRLPQKRETDSAQSRWPAVLRWLELFTLDSLERLVLKSPFLQRFVLTRHKFAFRTLLSQLPAIRQVGIVGGGLFPRTTLICRDLLPDAAITIIDASLDNIHTAQTFLNGQGKGVKYVRAVYGIPPAQETEHARSGPTDSGNSRQQVPAGSVETEKLNASVNSPEAKSLLTQEFDLVVIPLSFIGDRRLIYRCPEAAAVLVQDWIWRRHKTSAIISWLLLKRLNLVRR